ncbi:MAG: hypothetical protein U1C56_00035, partial [Candidatus Curtissbacteria bacterium]|nr:hypothetical protein [Candidatus Curtissbacteria bacterium]
MSFEFGKPEVTAIPEIPTKGGTSMLNKVLAKRAKERDLDLESNKPLNPNPGPQFDEKKAATILAKSKSKTKLTFKGEIELSMDLTKVPKYGDGSPPNLDALIPPGIKSLKVEFKVAGPEGKLTTRLSHTALRAETGSDDIGFYYLNDKGIKTPIKLPLNGEAKLTISPTDFENLTTTEIETRMAGRHARLLKKALTEGSKKALFGMAELMASDTQTSAKQAPPEPYYSQASYSPKSPAPSSGQLPDSTALPPKPSPQPLYEITQLSHSQDGTTEELMVGKYKVIVTRIPTTGEVSKIKCEDRTLLGPVRPEALDIIRQITPDEPFVKVPDPVNPKKIITTRESTYKLLLLANEFAKKDGFIMGCTSHWRNLTNQTEKFANSDG